MGSAKNLGGSLSKMHDLCFFTNLCLGIFDVCQLYAVLVSKVIKKIKILFSQFSLLLIAEY